MIYTAPYVMLLMRASPLGGQAEGGWALEIKTSLGPFKWHRAVRRVPFQDITRYFQKDYETTVVKLWERFIFPN
jgi:hypothetical protein